MRTLNLLWPTEYPEISKEVREIEKKEEVDIGVRPIYREKFDLRLYPFAERLSRIQERLELVEHRRTNERGYQVAIWGILLTATFGLVSAITGIIQAYASFRNM